MMEFYVLLYPKDIVTQITMGNRRKRDAEQNPVMQFIHDGGLEALKEGLPDIVIPLMVSRIICLHL